jgi:hypothetical protein
MFKATDPKPNLKFYSTTVNKPSQPPVMLEIESANRENCD